MYIVTSRFGISDIEGGINDALFNTLVEKEYDFINENPDIYIQMINLICFSGVNIENMKPDDGYYISFDLENQKINYNFSLTEIYLFKEMNKFLEGIVEIITEVEVKPHIHKKKK